MTLDLCSAANKIALKHNLLISLTLPLEILNIESRALGLNISFLQPAIISLCLIYSIVSDLEKNGILITLDDLKRKNCDKDMC